jgi:hypothetical protein
MKIARFALAIAFVLSTGGFAAAHGHKRHHHHMSRAGSPNGSAGGPTTISGTGDSKYGGSAPGTTGKN